MKVKPVNGFTKSPSGTLALKSRYQVPSASRTPKVSFWTLWEYFAVNHFHVTAPYTSHVFALMLSGFATMFGSPGYQ
jgi:hypothetical protein